MIGGPDGAFGCSRIGRMVDGFSTYLVGSAYLVTVEKLMDLYLDGIIFDGVCG